VLLESKTPTGFSYLLWPVVMGLCISASWASLSSVNSAKVRDVLLGLHTMTQVDGVRIFGPSSRLITSYGFPSYSTSALSCKVTFISNLSSSN